MMTFIYLSCNHHFVTYITYKSLNRLAHKINDYRLNLLKSRGPFLILSILFLILSPIHIDNIRTVSVLICKPNRNFKGTLLIVSCYDYH
jgi:hypothetical protein